MPKNVDQQILTQFKNPLTKEKAFTELVNTYQKPLYIHIFRIVNHHESTHDVLQNVFIKVWKHLDQFREDAQLSTWLFRIAVNESLSWLEKEEKQKTSALPEEDTFNRGSLSTPSATQIEQKLEKAIQALPTKQRIVFILRYYEERSYEEMSDILETSVGALKASYHHAVKKIEEYIQAD